MSRRLYYDDAYTTRFEARIVERLDVRGQPGIILDRTYFYPDSGGQPADTGQIGGADLVALRIRESDAAIIHILSHAPPGDQVQCQIDWTRRFDHMQHHTGQHILTQAFVLVAGANTVGFHLSPDSVTIDLDQLGITDAVVQQAEELANQIVIENRPVTARLIQPDEAARVRIRKAPDHLATQGLRVIDIQDYDLTACGGTHVARTGEIGLIKILRLEKRGDRTRVEFRCGWRALRDYQTKHAVVAQLVSDLTCGVSELPEAVSRLQQESRAAQRTIKMLREQLIDEEAQRLLDSAHPEGSVRWIEAVFTNRDPGEIRLLAARLTRSAQMLALLATSGDKAHLVLARSADLDLDLNSALKAALVALGGGRGGGPPDMVQGGGIPADEEKVAAALRAARASLLHPR